MLNLDLAILRSLAVAADLGSYAKAAERLGRTQSALSLQMRRLEDQLGQTLFRKDGRRLALTEGGEQLLGYARRLIALNDEAVAASRGLAVQGNVRLGVPQDFADAGLPDVLGRYARAHPQVRIEVRVERNVVLQEQIERGDLDLALIFGPGAPGAQRLAQFDMVWIGARAGEDLSGIRPLPLVAFDAPCMFRQAAARALDDADIAWHNAFLSPSLAGLWAAVAAGLGVTVRTRYGLPERLAVIEHGLPALPDVALWLHASTGELSPAAARLREIVVEAIESH